jgi:hypothetical protein
MQRFLIRFFLAHPLASVALGVVILLGAAGGGAWAYKRGKDLPQAPTPVTLSDVEAHASGNQWLRIDGAPIQCERSVSPTADAYVPLGGTPSGAYVVAFIGQRPCAKLSATPADGVVGWASEKRASRLFDLQPGEKPPRVLIVDMVDTPGFIRIVPWLLAPFILMSAALILWGLRQRSRTAPQNTDVAPYS